MRLLIPTRLIAALVASSALFAQGFQPVQIGGHLVPHSTAANGSGVCVADFNGNGLQDIVIAPAAGQPFVMLRNDGNMQFTNVSAASGLGTPLQMAGIQAADVDNDGDQDLFVGGAMNQPLLYINDGTGVFTEEGHLRGLTFLDDVHSASFGDYDRDGWLDLAIANRVDATGWAPGENRLYRNIGNGHFVDASANVNFVGNRLSFNLTFVDFNEDQWPDLMEVNDRGPIVGPNELYINNADGTFTPVGALYGANAAVDGMCFDYVDVFNDGGLDYYVTDTLPDHLFQVWDETLGGYLNQTWNYGLAGGGIGWAANFLDYDNDGWQDLFVVQDFTANLAFRNPAAPAATMTPWTNLAATLGLDRTYAQYTMSTADFDNDGAIDVLYRYPEALVQESPVGLELLRNDEPTGNWIKLRLTGTASNRDGIGARIEVEAAGMTQRQYRRSGIGYISGSDHRVHFGVGTAATIDRISILWPSGQKQFLTNVTPNQILEISEPQITCAGPATPGGSTTVTCSIPGDEGLLYIMPLSLSTNFGTPLPDNLLFPLDNDSVLDYTLDVNNPIFVGSVGVLDANGEATATFNVPNLPWLSGFVLYSSAMTIDIPSFTFARTIIDRVVEVPIQ